MAKKLPPNYHRDWQKTRAKEDPQWYKDRKANRTGRRQQAKADAVIRFGSVCNICAGTFF